MAQIEMEERSHHEQLYKSEEQAMRYGIPTTAYQVGEARDRSHKGMLNRPFPALEGDDISHTFKGDAEIRPDRGSDQQVEDQKTRIELDPSNQLRTGTNVGNRHSVHNVIDQPYNLPAPVALAQVPITFKKGVSGTSLIENSYAVAQCLCLIHVMGSDQDGGIMLFAQLLDEVLHIDLGARVQARSRLIQ